MTEAYVPQGTTFGVKAGEVYTTVALVENIKLGELTSKTVSYVTHDNLKTRYLPSGVIEVGEGELVLIYDGSDPFLAKIGDSLDVQIGYPSGDKATFTMIVTGWELSDADVNSNEPLKATVKYQAATAYVWS